LITLKLRGVEVDHGDDDEDGPDLGDDGDGEASPYAKEER
jgi:hypothetical protein